MTYYCIITVIMQANTTTNYKDHKAIFEQIKVEDRPAWIEKMLAIEQKKGEYVLYSKNYPAGDKWKYKGDELHYYYFQNKNPAKAILFYFHGLNAHGNGSAYFTMGIAEKCPIDVYALDFKNFGRSSGEERGYIPNLESILEQAEDFVTFILEQQKDKKKVFISGLSLGGGVSFKLALRHPERYDGVIFLSPALKENRNVQPFMKKVGKAFGYLFPTWRLVDQKFDGMSKYDQTQRIMDDPYLYKGKIVPGTIKVVLDMMQEIEGEWPKFTTPFILIQSGIDKAVDPFLGIDFQKFCGSKDKTVIYFKDMWHAIFVEDELPEVIEAVTEWLEPRTK